MKEISIPLSELPLGMSGTIVSLNLDSETVGRFMGMGLFPGSHVKVMVKSRSDKPLLISVGDTRIAMGKEYARYIFVETNSETSSTCNSSPI